MPLAGLEDLVFGAWDPIPDDGYESAVKAGVLDRHEHLEPIKDFLSAIKPMPAVFDTRLREEAERPQREEGREQAGPRRADPRGHPPLQEGERLRPAGHGLVRLHRGLRAPERGPRDPRVVREGDGREPRRHRPEPALRLRRDHGGHPVRQRRAEPLRRLPGARGARQEERGARSAARTSRPARP